MNLKKIKKSNSENKNKGFTLIEIIIAVGILAIIMSFGMVVNFHSFTSSITDGEESKIVSVLEKARSRAMANMFDSTYGHGVCYVAPNYIIFRDRNTCLPIANTDQNIPADVGIATNSNFSNHTKFPTIIFARLTGKLSPQIMSANNEIDIVVDNGNDFPKHIKINNEGRINW